MKPCLVLGVLFALAFSANAASTQALAVQAARPALTEIRTAAPTAPRAQPAAVQSPAPPRHLSDLERAELRRQLQQFNQQYIRRP